MIRSYLLLAYRNVLKHKAAFLINLIGMSIALGVCITAFVNYQYNVDFDRTQQHADKIFRVSFWQQTEKGKVPYGIAPIPMANILKGGLSEGDQVIQYMSKGGQFRIGDEVFSKEIVYTDPAFTKVFSMERLSGSLDLTDKSTMLISDKLAMTYFGTTNAVGQQLTQIISGEPKSFVVAGIYKAFPANSSFRFDLLTSYDNYFKNPEDKITTENNWGRWATTFLYLNDPSTANTLLPTLEKYISKQNEARPDLKINEFYIESFIGMGARAARQRNQGHWFNSSMPPAAVIAPFAMAGFMLLLACFNFMNNAIAVAGRRLREIGIRKAVGGKRKELVIQFLSETFVFCIAALALALVLAEYFTDGWNSMWRGLEITISYQDNIMLFIALFGLLSMTALLAGAYPALYISRFRPIEVLRNTVKIGAVNNLTKTLLVLQFSISLAAVIFALAFYFNAKFQKEYDLGYSWRSVIHVPLENSQQYDLLRNELAENPLINNIAGGEHHIFSSTYTAAARHENKTEKEIDVLNIGDDYFKTVNVRLLEGREFQKDAASDIKEAIIVNEEFVRQFKLGTNAIGARITLNDTVQTYIVGVVKDVYLNALFEPLSPVAFRYTSPSRYRYFISSTDPDQLHNANAAIAGAWKKLFPNALYPGRLMEENMTMALEHFDSVVILYTFLGFVAIVMSVSGLYSLVSLNLQKRTKELGIRKIMGASLRHIVFQSSKLFIVIMCISFIAGSLLGMVMVNALMNTVWEYYEAVDLKVVTIAIMILMSIAVITIGMKIRNAALANAVDALKHE